MGWSGRQGQRNLTISEIIRNNKGQFALFTGNNNTGKLSATVTIAKSLDLDVFRVDHSLVAGKSIGETEKNLATIFDKAFINDWILFFDEADALFGKRTKVKAIHDRFTNIDVSQLLKKIERYQGLLILSSNYPFNDMVGKLPESLTSGLVDVTFETRQRKKVWHYFFNLFQKKAYITTIGMAYGSWLIVNTRKKKEINERVLQMNFKIKKVLLTAEKLSKFGFLELL